MCKEEIEISKSRNLKLNNLISKLELKNYVIISLIHMENY